MRSRAACPGEVQAGLKSVRLLGQLLAIPAFFCFASSFSSSSLDTGNILRTARDRGVQFARTQASYEANH